MAAGIIILMTVPVAPHLGISSKLKVIKPKPTTNELLRNALPFPCASKKRLN